MTRFPLNAAASVIVAVLLSVCTAGSQLGVAPPSTKAERPEPPAQHSCQDVAHASYDSVMRRAVAPPSPDFTTYLEGELVRVSVPSDWRELPGFNAVTFAPEGGYGNAGLKSVFTHGVGIGLAHSDRRSLR